MHFAISLLNFRPGRIGGTETYLRGLIDALPGVLGDDRVTLILHPEASQALPDNGLSRHLVRRSNRRLLASRLLEAFTPWRDRALEQEIQGLGCDAFLFPQQSIYPKGINGPVALTVVDVQHLVLPQNIAAVDRLFRSAIYPHSMRRAEGIITISQTVSETLTQYCGIPVSELDTVLLGFEANTALGELPPDLPTSAPYLYFPAVTHPHKNHLLLLSSFADLVRTGQLPHNLILSGQKTPYWKTIEKRIAELSLQERVHHAGYVSSGQVQALYRDAAAVVFPTQFEGFGLPVVEAFAAGTRAIVSEIPVFQELGVPESLRIDFSDAQALCAAVLAPGPFQLQRKPVPWAQTATETLEVLRRIAKGRGRRAMQG